MRIFFALTAAFLFYGALAGEMDASALHQTLDGQTVL
jgi:hypothetical protein